ncbi:DUF3310 domain-containing protein [Rhizobium phage RHph_N3_13]|nr:DUF3310 domain-containing protein [Rhizobium phage RHph_N3_13]QIG73078.1 DUF3310 domain-containing protein [Rhizobium phage RHph_N3_19]
MSDKPSPKDRQVAGTHYKDMAIQPGEYVVKNGIGWYEGNAIKYLTRHKAKGQKQDLEKAIHYIELAIEHYYENSKSSDSTNVEGDK